MKHRVRGVQASIGQKLKLIVVQLGSNGSPQHRRAAQARSARVGSTVWWIAAAPSMAKIAAR
jgi:hypothetical protein